MCIDSVDSALSAERGGASRVELCGNLVEGGTTPTVGMLQVIKQNISIPVFVMIRLRGSDFLYSDDEFTVMKKDLEILQEHGADGIVFGALTAEGDIDVEKTKVVAEMAHPLPVTFHRAFDMTREPTQSLETLIKLGITRVLTSGQDSTALEGLPLIKKLVELAGGRITVVPGGGITERNVERILKGTGAKEFHCSARSSCQSKMRFRNSCVTMGASFGPLEFSVKVADCTRVENLVSLATQVWK